MTCSYEHRTEDEVAKPIDPALAPKWVKGNVNLVHFRTYFRNGGAESKLIR